MEKTAPALWSIEARAFSLPYLPCSHNFWALVAPGAIVVDQIHGLAVHPVTGRAKAVGSSRDLLQAVRDACIVWSLQPNQPKVPVYSGSENAIRGIWLNAVSAIPAINALRLPYPDLWQHGYRPNSNTIFAAIGRIMRVESPGLLLPTWAPGIRLNVAQDIVLRYLGLPNGFAE